MNDPTFLYQDALLPEYLHNEHREPLLTYSHAYELIENRRSQHFGASTSVLWRQHVRLLAPLRAEVDSFIENARSGRFLISAHVKHPSHVVEQPSGRMPDRDAYVRAVRHVLQARAIDEGTDGWRVFVATDQDRVIELFTQEFGHRAIFFSDVRRIPIKTDEAYDALDEEERSKDGHQLQHIIASAASQWAPQLAWEVWRDAEVMAASDVLIHVVSNVATAASYLNPELEMVYCAA